MTKIIEFPPNAKPPEFIFGPFEEHRVVIEGRCIPKLTARRERDGVALIVDRRFSITVPQDLAFMVAWLVANAIAIGAGYAYLGSETKEQPFAPRVSELPPLDGGAS